MTCPDCGHATMPSDHFCGWCGAALGTASSATWQPTNHTGPNGAETYAAPDPNQPLAQRLDPGLAVELVETSDGWAHVRCSNGWHCWVDARLLAPAT